MEKQREQEKVIRMGNGDMQLDVGAAGGARHALDGLEPGTLWHCPVSLTGTRGGGQLSCFVVID